MTTPHPRLDHSPTILLADDDPNVLAVLTSCLMDQDFNVITAKNGIEAMQIVKEQTLDLALLDVRMPGHTGLDILQTIRADHTGTELPVILLSVEDDIQTVVFALEMGANDYIAKPISLEVLSARVRTQLEVKRLHDLSVKHIAELQHMDAMKDQFLQIAAHDLRNPLNVMQLGVEFLGGSAGANSTKEERDLVATTVRDSIAMMQSIINDFLDLRAMQEGKIKLELAKLDPGDLVNQAVEQFRSYAAKKEITLSVEAAPNLPTLSADGNRLKQVLHNLISNAIKFSMPGTQVIVRASPVARGVLVEVEDTGPGIPAEEIPMLFREFTHLSNRPTGRGERSSGVGLSIARRLVELHRGRIGVESEVGRGSMFWFEIPIEQ